MRPDRAAILFTVLLIVTACTPWRDQDGPPAAGPAGPPADSMCVDEPRSRSGNPPFYEVFGERYHLLPTNRGYLERGVASWYGTKFHGKSTATGEAYDMHAMTAAHKTLPLPACVEVVNLTNGRRIIVRVNDRGPFVDNRIIDLSYAAAHELDMVRDGTALVEVRSLSGNALAPESVASRETASPAREMFVQAGAFTDRTNADRQSLWLNQYNLGKVQIRTVERADGRVVHRVWLGPVPDVAGFDAMVAKLQELGIRDAHLAVAP